MDYLLTGIVIALICLAAWLFYKRWVGSYKAAPAPEEYDEIEEEETPAVAEPTAESIPEPVTTEEK